MRSIKLNDRMQAILLIVVGIIIGIGANTIDKYVSHTFLVTAIGYMMIIISVSLVGFGIIELFKKSD